MPIYMRLPKRGFTSIFKQQFNIVNLDALEKFPAGAKIDLEALTGAGLIRDADLPIKLLGRGTLDKKLEISVHKASTSAKEAIEKAGGTLQELGYKKRGDAARAKLMKNKKPKIRGVNAKRAWREANPKKK
jgi:large subunit ribosomal protein L15